MHTAPLDYLKQTYQPHTILAYGSYTCGTQTEWSDYDVLVITDRAQSQHDGSVVEGVRLDAFVYHTQDYLSKQDLSEFLQVYGGQILLDERGLARALLTRLEKHVAEHAVISVQEKNHLRSWCVKMLARAQAGDPEGMLRWHWLLYDSLEIYCSLRDQFYFGPKKTMQSIRNCAPVSYKILERALYQMDFKALSAWISCVLDI